MPEKATSRSPLTDRPLRVAGQSLDEEIRKLIDTEVGEAAFAAVVAIIIALFEWVRWFRDIPPQPVVLTVFAGAVGAWAVWRVTCARQKLKQLRQGRDGERAVAELLERLREVGFRVFHDVLGPGFNVDHVLVGRRGVYALETKTITKPRRGSPRITYDGDTVTLAGYKPDRDPLRQAAALARWVEDLIRESAGRACRVRPIVLYPGWFVDAGANKNKATWVLNPRALSSFIEHEPEVLQAEDVNLIAFHLSRYCRGVKESPDV